MDNASITSEATKTRTSRGRQRIEIKKLEDEAKRQVTFSKRRRGLFKKAKELSTLCGAEVAVLALSKAGKLYTTDDVDTLLDRFLVESSNDNVNSLLPKQKEVEDEENGGFWWDQPIENLGPVELLEYMMALNELREDAAARIEETKLKL